MKQFKTILTADYVPDWTVEDGVREVITNALDSPAKMEYEIGDDYIRITSVGITLPASILAMGKSGNRQDTNAVGKHGEGSLVGMIPVLREGLKYLIENGDKIWIPSFQYDNDLEQEILVIDEKSNPNINSNYTIEISGLSEDHIFNIKQRCLYLQEDIGEVVDCNMGRLLLQRSGEVFVGGIWVCNNNTLKYSYDFHPSVLPVNRDRKMVSEWDLKINTSKLLSLCLNSEKLATNLVEQVGDLSYSNYASGSVSNEVADLVFDKVVAEHGEGVVFANNWGERGSLEQKGYKNVELILNDPLYHTISHSPKYQEYFENIEIDEEIIEKPIADQFREWYNDWVDDGTDSERHEGYEEWEELIDKLENL